MGRMRGWGLERWRNPMSITRYGITDGTSGRPIISGVVVHGDTVYMSGVTADPGGDITAQTQQVLDRIDAALQMVGTEQIEAPERPGLAGRHAVVRGAQCGVERLGRSAEPTCTRLRGCRPCRYCWAKTSSSPMPRGDHGDRRQVSPSDLGAGRIRLWPPRKTVSRSSGQKRSR